MSRTEGCVGKISAISSGGVVDREATGEEVGVVLDFGIGIFVTGSTDPETGLNFGGVNMGSVGDSDWIKGLAYDKNFENWMQTWTVSSWRT